MAFSRPTPSPSATATDDAALAVRLRAGDEKAYEELVRLYGGQMLAVARRFLPDENDARDALQDAFLAAFRAIDGFEGKSRVSSWLHRIVVNAALMKLRSRRRRPEHAIDDLLPRFSRDGHRQDVGPTWTRTSDEILQREETRALIRRRIHELPDDYRDVLLLRDIEEFDTRSTAAQLEISEAAVKTRLHRARQALRALLERDLT